MGHEYRGTITYHKNVDNFALGLTFLAVIKAKEGQNLKPIAEQSTDSEFKQPIGFTLFSRNKNKQKGLLGLLAKKQTELIVARDSESDSQNMLIVKEVIRRATSFNPDDRPAAHQIMKQLEVRALRECSLIMTWVSAN